MDIAQSKQALRKEALARRAALSGRAERSRQIAANFLNAFSIPPGGTVSAFVAIGEEADPAPLIVALRERGAFVALPRVVGKGKPLSFHLYASGATLVPGPFGLLQPAADWPLAEPDVLAVPLLAFDALGNRLGYGAGFYDRTLEGLRARRPVLAAGYAFAAQEFPLVPHHEGDQKLDWIVTDAGARKFER
jgi:5-formyltetrahydrofolate cyclo-ligase